MCEDTFACWQRRRRKWHVGHALLDVDEPLWRSLKLRELASKRRQSNSHKGKYEHHGAREKSRGRRGFVRNRAASSCAWTELPARAEAEAACFACFFSPLTAAPPGRLFVYMAS